MLPHQPFVPHASSGFVPGSSLNTAIPYENRIAARTHDRGQHHVAVARRHAQLVTRRLVRPMRLGSARAAPADGGNAWMTPALIPPKRGRQRVHRLLARVTVRAVVPSPAVPAEMTAYFGFTRSRNAADDEVLLPWWPTWSSVIGALMARSASS